MWRNFLALVAVLGLAALGGCLELAGQRITIRHDADGDRLLLLVCHDGIHESDRKSTHGSEQLAAHIENGDILLLDWFGHFERAKARSLAERAETAPAFSALLLALVEDVSTHAVGHYVDPDGRIGAAQLIVVAHARAFLRKVNAAINEALVERGEAKQPSGLAADAPKTFALLLREARRDRQWLVLSGHAVTVSFPVALAEWAKCRAGFIADFGKEWVRRDGEDPRDVHPAGILQLLLGEGFTMAQLGEVVAVSIGGVREPQTLRAVLFPRYNDRLEAAVLRLVPVSFDGMLAELLLGTGPAGAADAWLQLAMSCAAPEDRVRAVLAARSAGESRAAAQEWLRAFAEQWNAAGRLPVAPPDGAEPSAWGDWYRQVLAFPMTPQTFEASLR